MESVMDEQELTQEEREASADWTEDEAAAPEEGNGKTTLADLAANQPDAEGDEPEEREPQLFGTESKVTGSVKGSRPTTSSIKFRAAPVTVSGQFQPDDVLELRVLARLDKVEFVYTRDRDGNVKGVKRVHHATATSTEQVPSPATHQAIFARMAELVGGDVTAEQLLEAYSDASAEALAQ